MKQKNMKSVDAPTTREFLKDVPPYILGEDYSSDAYDDAAQRFQR